MHRLRFGALICRWPAFRPHCGEHSVELQRCCIVRALNPATRYILADEMTTMLDAIAQAEIWAALIETTEAREIGLVVVSHEASLLARLCDDVFAMPARISA